MARDESSGGHPTTAAPPAGDTGDGRSSTWLVEGSTDAVEVAGRYDRWAGTYDDDLRSWSYRAPAVVADLLVTRMPSADSVLDAGCGTGLVGHALRVAGFAGEVHGIDISGASLRIAEETGAYTTLARADLQQPIDLAADAVDAVVCVGVMTYVPDVDAAWREFARVVRPGGLVIVTQREDLWAPRRCEAVIERLFAEGVWAPLEVTGPAPYLPDNTDGMGPVGVLYVTARVS